MAAIIYEAIAPDKLPCLYVHHDLEFPENLDYVEELKDRGFMVEVLNPFLEYFELTERGIGFLTLVDAWCVPMLVGTGLLHWLKRKGTRGPREGVMFRGMSGSEIILQHDLHADQSHSTVIRSRDPVEVLRLNVMDVHLQLFPEQGADVDLRLKAIRLRV